MKDKNISLIRVYNNRQFLMSMKALWEINGYR